MEPNLKTPNNFNVPGLSQKQVFLAAFIIVVIGVAIIGYIFTNIYQTDLPEQIDSPELIMDADLSVKPEGKIYLTLKPIDGDLPQSIYSFDITSKKLEKLFTDHEKGGFITTNKFLPEQEDIMAFVSLDEEERSQIFISDISGDEVVMITEGGAVTKTNPEWSHNGDKIAFSTQESSTDSEPLSPESWSVYVMDLMSAEETFISKGTYPKWSPDGKKLLIMKNDGLYLYDVGDNKLNKRVWEVIDGETYIGMKLGLSHDGSMLAWSNANNGRVVLFKISSWNPFTINAHKQFETHAFWPVFSQDNRFLVVQEIDWTESDETNPRLVIYDLATGNRETILDLGDYEQEAMFVTDWR